MKILGVTFKREYILQYSDNHMDNNPLWFYDEPKDSKEEILPRIQFLNRRSENKTKIKLKTRFIIEV